MLNLQLQYNWILMKNLISLKFIFKYIEKWCISIKIWNEKSLNQVADDNSMVLI